MKLKKLLEHTLGELPSEKLLKMKWNPLKESQPVNEDYDERVIQEFIDTVDNLAAQCKGYKQKKAIAWAQKYSRSAGNKSFQETIDRIANMMKKFN
jgi:predicted oxidoreductase